uniref:Uncharacterized protein n=1 Tax=Rhizophora mucronata TaxID=61149 RepID=A0A2P2P3E6_RHIMU
MVDVYIQPLTAGHKNQSSKRTSKIECFQILIMILLVGLSVLPNNLRKSCESNHMDNNETALQTWKLE